MEKSDRADRIIATTPKSSLKDDMNNPISPGFARAGASGGAGRRGPAVEAKATARAPVADPAVALILADARGARQTADYTDRAGAEKLKARIEAYWRERGSEVQVTLIPAGFTAALRAARYDVRSELLNGLPRRDRHASFGGSAGGS